jgi:hypothetical protein
MTNRPLIDTAYWPTRRGPAAGRPGGRAARGSVVPRKMACRPAAGERENALRFKAIGSR